jgi:hypothetical protein
MTEKIETLDPKKPIEQWRFEIIADEREILGLMSAPGRVMSFKDSLRFFGTAIMYGERYLEVQNLTLLENGTLVPMARIGGLQHRVLEIDVADLSNASALSSLKDAFLEREAVRRTKVYFQKSEAYRAPGSSEKTETIPWSVSGHLKGNVIYGDTVCLDNEGKFYMQNQRKSWESRVASHELLRMP